MSIRIRRSLLRSLAPALVLVFSATDVSAQSSLADALGGLAWGASVDDVVDFHRDRILAEYRTEIAGIRDPIEIDRLRRLADERVNSFAASATALDGARTGYEVSVIQDEVSAGVGQSILTLRDDLTLNYYVFHSGRLAKVIVTFDQASLNFIGFEAFVERLESVFGGPNSTDWRVDDIGVRHMTRATWADATTRARAEDKARMFAAYLLVYVDASIDEVLATDAVADVVRPSGTRDLGALMRSIESEGPTGTASDAIVDQLTGRVTEVDVRVLAQDQEELDAAAATEAADAAAAAEAAAAAQAAEEAEAAARAERARARSRDSRADDDDEPADAEVIY